MGQKFVPYEPDQVLLFPPSLDDWLPVGHLARFVSETVEELDLSPFYTKFRTRDDGRGRIAYEPRMMLKVLIYSYCQGLFSSRKIAAGIEDLVALRFLAAGNQPSHRTIARFRQENIDQFNALFVQVVRIAMGIGLVRMGTVAIDGTKLKANASKHKAMSYGRMKEEERRLAKEIAALTRQAQQIDEAEDEEFGADRRGDELPNDLQRKEDRVAKIRAAKERLEREQAEEDEAAGRGKGKVGPKLKRPNGVPKDTKQVNFTDPESRIMGNPKKGFIQGYNGQIAVDDEMSIIVATGISQSAADVNELLPVTEEAIRTTGQKPERVLADAGYKSESGLAGLEQLEIEGHVALGKGENEGRPSSKEGPATKRMRRRRGGVRSQRIYRRRKVIAEPPFGWIKSVIGFRGFSMRGLRKAKGEWDLVCLAMNLRRLAPRMEWA
jgi:transposase